MCNRYVASNSRCTWWHFWFMKIDQSIYIAGRKPEPAFLNLSRHPRQRCTMRAVRNGHVHVPTQEPAGQIQVELQRWRWLAQQAALHHINAVQQQSTALYDRCRWHAYKPDKSICAKVVRSNTTVSSCSDHCTAAMAAIVDDLFHSQSKEKRSFDMSSEHSICINRRSIRAHYLTLSLVIIGRVPLVVVAVGGGVYRGERDLFGGPMCDVPIDCS
jgi:hypothetical protein